MAGLSVEYYARLERGQIAGASTGVLDALARALQLDETERAHLSTSPGPLTASRPRAVPAAGRRARPRRGSACSGRWRRSRTASRSSATRTRTCSPRTPWAAPSTRPVIGDGGRDAEPRPVPVPRPRLRDFYPDWDLFAEMCVGIMRAEAGRDPHDRGLQDLVGELSTRSEIFRRLWADHNVRTHGTGTKRFQHPVVGELTLAYEELAITAEPGLVLLVYTAEPGSPSAERLQLLASWAVSEQATVRTDHPQEESQHTHEAHPQLRRHRSRSRRLVHRRRLHRRHPQPGRPDRRRLRPRPLLPRCSHRMAPPPQGPNPLRHRRHRVRRPAGQGRPSHRRSAPATSSTSSQTRSTGTAPPPAGSWPTSPSRKPTTRARS